MPTLVENVGAGIARAAQESKSIRTALTGKSDVGHTHPSTEINDSTPVGRDLLMAASALAARGVIGAGTSSLVLGSVAGTAKAGDWLPSSTNITDSTSTGRAVLTAVDATAARAAMSAGTSNLTLGSTGSTAAPGNHTHAYSSLTGIPSTFAPSGHTHAQTDITGLSASLAAKADLVGGLIPTSQIPPLSLTTAVTVASQAAMLALTTAQVQPGDIAIRTDGAGTFILTATDPSVLANWSLLNSPTDSVTSVNGQIGAVSLGKADVGLGNVSNLAPADLPVSTATTTALAGKENTLAAGTSAQYYRGDKTWQTLNKAAVGLANVDNVADSAKPVSTAQQTALNAKENTIAAGTTSQYYRGDKTWQVLNAAAVGLSAVDNTSDAQKPVSTAQQSALNAKENTITAGTTAQYWRGDKTWQTLNAATVGLGNVLNLAPADYPVSIAQQSALNAKAPLDNPVFTTGIATPAFKMTTSPVSGRILVSDGTGNGSWGIYQAAYRNTAAGWSSGYSATALAAGVIAYETDTQKIKVGDGTSFWAALPYIGGSGGSTGPFAISDVTNLQTTLDAKATKANGVLGTGLPWSKEFVINSSALANGFNDNIGGVMTDRAIVLESMVFRLADPAEVIGGTGNLTVQWYRNDVTGGNSSLIATSNIAATSHDRWEVLETPLAVDINYCLRASVTLGTTTVAGKVHVEWRGRYA